MVSLGIGSNLKILRFVILSLDRVQFANGFGLKKKMLGLYAATQSIWMDMIMQDHLILYAHNRNGLSDHAYFYAAA